MKQFFKFMLASMVGFFLSVVLMIVFFVVMLFIAVASMDGEKNIVTPSNSVLHITLNYKIEERTNNNPFSNFDFKSFRANPDLGLNDIISNIKEAKTDENIKGIYLDVSVVQAGLASLEEIRDALIDFKESKKFIIAYSEQYIQAAYYIASVADKIYLNPQGELDFKGLKAEILFFKGTLEKLELEPEIIRHGKFKSAIEPFILEKMSPENRQQTAAYMNSIWNHVIEKIAVSRKINQKNLAEIASSLLVQSAEDAYKYKLVDSLMYYDEVLANLGKKTGVASGDKVNFVRLTKYNDAPAAPEKTTGVVRDKIAVIYAFGNIVDGKGEATNIGSLPLAETIRKARLDESIKGIVFRVNSPGGSALASEVIWREIYLAKKAKPVVVSMGDYAASGGYYIACAADSIVAEPTTITGSIGVFGVLFNGRNLLKNKLGVTVDTVRTGNYSDIGTFTRPLTASERAIIQRKVEKVYTTFLTRVANGRRKSNLAIDSIAQGRVWSGTDALRIGLVDALGGIDKAMAMVAKMAKVDRYRIVSLPEQKDPFTKILEGMAGETESILVKHQLGESYKYWKKFNSLTGGQGIQARMPYEIDFY